MLRISTTTLEQFRQFYDGVKGFNDEYYCTESDLVEYITGEFKPSKYMDYGTAFHEIIAEPDKYRFAQFDGTEITTENFNQEIKEIYVYKKVTFNKSIEPAFDYFYKKYPAEIKETKHYSIEGEDVVLVAKADQIVGNIVIENKTKYSNLKMDDYYSSYQWRVYCIIFESPKVVYQIFNLKETKDKDGLIVELKKINLLQFTAYNNMENDVINLLSEFVRWIKLKKLERFFDEKRK